MPEVKFRKKLKESTLINLWIWKFHPMSVQWRRVRLGVVPNHELAKMYNVLLRWADAIYIEDGVVNIVEAKLRPKPDAFGQLELYERLFRETPEFTAYKTYPIKKIFLTTMKDLALQEMATDTGVDYVIWVPPGYDPLTGYFDTELTA